MVVVRASPAILDSKFLLVCTGVDISALLLHFQSLGTGAPTWTELSLDFRAK